MVFEEQQGSNGKNDSSQNATLMNFQFRFPKFDDFLVRTLLVSGDEIAADYVYSNRNRPAGQLQPSLCPV